MQNKHAEFNSQLLLSEKKLYSETNNILKKKNHSKIITQIHFNLVNFATYSIKISGIRQ